MATVASWVSKKANRCGGEACVRDTRITVWGLVAQRRKVAADAEILQAMPVLTRADLDAAWEYASTHSDEIERAIRENEAGDAGLIE